MCSCFARLCDSRIFSYRGLREAGPGSLTVTVKSVLAGLHLGNIIMTTQDLACKQVLWRALGSREKNYEFPVAVHRGRQRACMLADLEL